MIEAFRAWQSFYLLTGATAATLTGLVFVAASLGASLMGSAKVTSGLRTFVTPTVMRPVYGGTNKFQDDPHWRDYILFYEYFHGENGAGLGASHQTGWTGLVARILDLFARLKPADALRSPKEVIAEMTRQEVTGK